MSQWGRYSFESVGRYSLTHFGKASQTVTSPLTQNCNVPTDSFECGTINVIGIYRKGGNYHE